MRIGRLQQLGTKTKFAKKAVASDEKVESKKEGEEMKLKELCEKLGKTCRFISMKEHCSALLEVVQRIMKLSPEELRKEAAFEEGDYYSLLASPHLPLVYIAKLCTVLDIDLRDGRGNTAIILAAFNGYYDTVDYFARSNADLSIINNRGQNLYTISKSVRCTSQDDKEAR
jgi:hypothetical protein